MWKPVGQERVRQLDASVCAVEQERIVWFTRPTFSTAKGALGHYWESAAWLSQVNILGPLVNFSIELRFARALQNASLSRADVVLFHKLFVFIQIPRDSPQKIS
jgi:hypothetical protein